MYTGQVKSTSAIPKALEDKVARVARRLGKPRRLVIKDAIDEYVARHDPDAITQAMNRVAEVLDTRSEPSVAGAARRILENTEW
jgi:predicted DNA-binding protein